ncbi:MAG: hypothetical protein ABFD50_14820 [Smithella sp.]
MIFKRSELREVPFSSVLLTPQEIVVISSGKWNSFLESAYDAGNTLVEMDDNNFKAYRKWE